ncbi:hypothetical protein Bca52824_000125 [Brassica carinata]|uniref:Chalcone-flavonone isomerase family protein n=1 Tax=Brassica carinata TaxID=52824 RepID=A0A8X8BBD3_BRACI|nr:hypothetical protein Bca52824_000125 [Brassica carinata]
MSPSKTEVRSDTEYQRSKHEVKQEATLKLPLTGKQYSEKVTENCEATWESLGIYADSDISCIPPPSAKILFNKITKEFGPSRDYSRGQVVERFLKIFKNKNFPPDASILFALSHEGSLTYKHDDSIPKISKTVIENKLLAEAVLESIIGNKGVSPGARLSVAERFAQLMENQSRIWANPDNTLTLANTKFMKKKNKVKEDATKTDQRRDEEN